jgi:MerR family transcriptional regulator/heat shock protein HspR
MATLRGFSPDDDTPVFVISVAAELAGMRRTSLLGPGHRHPP